MERPGTYPSSTPTTWVDLGGRTRVSQEGVAPGDLGDLAPGERSNAAVRLDEHSREEQDTAITRRAI